MTKCEIVFVKCHYTGKYGYHFVLLDPGFGIQLNQKQYMYLKQSYFISTKIKHLSLRNDVQICRFLLHIHINARMEDKI